MDKKTNNPLKRRDFIKTAALGAAAFSIMPTKTALGSDANSKINLGLIGCGQRGKWIANLFEEHAPFKVVAVHDYFKDQTDSVGEERLVDAKRRHIGLDGYKELLQSELDAVAVISPPYFHPEHGVAVLEAGKHLYMAKPIAVDVPGCLALVNAANKHGKTLSSLVDFQTRKNEFYIGAAERVHAGMIGFPVSGQCYYHSWRLRIKSAPGTEVARLRNWTFDIALSGDTIVEQKIHVLDVANWLLQSNPIKAYGVRGRKARTEVGDTSDHYALIYHYPDDVIISFSSSQFLYGFDDLCVRVFGSEGIVDTHYGGEVYIRGKSDGWKGGKTDDIYAQGAINNIKDFHKAIVSGEHLNNMEVSANSTMTAILGRMAANSGETVTWDTMYASKERLDPKLNLPEDGPLTLPA